MRARSSAIARRCSPHFDCAASLFGKPSKFRRVIRRAGVEPGKVIAIGDEVRDIEAARAVGIACGAVGWGYAAPAALRALAPDHMFERMDEIAVDAVPRCGSPDERSDIRERRWMRRALSRMSLRSCGLRRPYSVRRKNAPNARGPSPVLTSPITFSSAASMISSVLLSQQATMTRLPSAVAAMPSG